MIKKKITNGSLSINKKVKNATITYLDGIKFLSKLEAHVYRRLKDLNIQFSYEKSRIILIKGFEYDGKKIRDITYKPDFVTENFIIECKGFPTDAWRLREKLVKRRLMKDYKNIKFFVIKSPKQFEEIASELVNLNTNKNVA